MRECDSAQALAAPTRFEHDRKTESDHQNGGADHRSARNETSPFAMQIPLIQLLAIKLAADDFDAHKGTTTAV